MKSTYKSQTPAEFDAQNKTAWAVAIANTFKSAAPESARWTEPRAMMRVLRPFLGENLNQVMLPGGGGFEFLSVEPSRESGCIDFSDGDRLGNVCRPDVLYFEHFPESPWNSFFLLETRPLKSCGLYGDSESEYEEVVELPTGEYIHRCHHDTGTYGHDDHGREKSLPKEARTISRFLKGKFLFVAKRSIWNRLPETYDGRHNLMSSQQLRSQVSELVAAHKRWAKQKSHA